MRLVAPNNRQEPSRVVVYGTINSAEGDLFLRYWSLRKEKRAARYWMFRWLKMLMQKTMTFGANLRTVKSCIWIQTKIEPIHGCRALGSNCRWMQLTTVLWVVYYILGTMSSCREPLTARCSAGVLILQKLPSSRESALFESCAIPEGSQTN